MPQAAFGYPVPLGASLIRASRGKLDRWHGQTVVFLYGVCSVRGRPAVGFALRRTLGKAVLRNRFKRIVRHALGRRTLPPGAVLLCTLHKDKTLPNLSGARIRREVHRFLDACLMDKEWPVF